MTGKRILSIILCLMSAFCLCCCGSKAEVSEEKAYGTYKAVITVENYGDIELELYGDTAPITVKNFVDLANDGFYDGLTFHRIIDGFMIQGGDPKADGTGEFESNGVENDISHVRGVISMARSKDMDSASSQFFIVQEDSTYLDGDYAAFGKVTSGMEIVDKIAEETVVSGYNGEVDKENQPVITKITIKE